MDMDTDTEGMDTFEFHVTPDREERRKAGLGRQWEAVIRLRSVGYCEEAVWPGRKALPQWLTEAVENAAGGQPFSFDEPFSPWQLYDALNRSGLCFVLETDYRRDATEGPQPANPEDCAPWCCDVFGEHIRKTAVRKNVVTTEKRGGRQYSTSALTCAGKDASGPFTTSTEKAARRVHRHMVRNLKRGRAPEAGVEKLIKSLDQPWNAPWENNILKKTEAESFRVVTRLDVSSAKKRYATMTSALSETLFSPNEAIARQVHNRIVRNIRHGRHPLDQAQKIIDDYMQSWHVVMDDLADGRYDGDIDEVNRLIAIAVRRAEKPDCRPAWKESLERAVQHRTRLLTAEADKIASQPVAGKEEAFKKLKAQAAAAGTPDWVLSLYDILAGRCDEDLDAADRLLCAAEEEARKPDCAPGWKEAVDLAVQHRTQLLTAKARKIASLPAGKEEALKKLKARAAAAGLPDWVLSLYDILAGLCDTNINEAGRLLAAAEEEAKKPDCAPGWGKAVWDARLHLLHLRRQAEPLHAHFLRHCCGGDLWW